MMEEEERETPSVTPRVLSSNLIPTLTQGLDASDVLEVYALVRSASLHGLANSTIHFSKQSIGVRYRPPGGNGPKVIIKKPVELTLEYGPQRLGEKLEQEAAPFIQVEENTAFVAWDNVGKVYYTTKIVSEHYMSSYYMASMTGAVLNKVLVQAVEYAEKRRRYQPFSVYSEANGKELRSSSDTDFVQFLWQHLARLGVEIEPILPPPTYEARLWVGSLKKVIPEAEVAHAAAAFYQNLYTCLVAIATNDYTPFMPTAMPTISFSPTQSPSLSVSPSIQPSVFEELSSAAPTGKPSSVNEEDSGNTDNGDGDAPDDGDGDAPDNTDDSDEGASNAQKAGGNSDENDYVDGKNSTKEAGLDSDTIDEKTTPPKNKTKPHKNKVSGESGGEAEDTDGGNGGRLRRKRRRLDLEQEEINVYEKDMMGGEEESEDGDLNPPSSGGEDVDKAQQAAQDAQNAANEAKNAAQTEGDTKTADAAQAAADAAQAAAEATSNAAAQAAMDGLLSGDATAMSNIITSCLTDPKYGMGSVNEDGIMNTEAYLYRDGSTYYKLNLTSPYFEVVKVNRPLPKAVTLSDYGTGGDFIDWVLFFFLLGTIAFALLVLLQQMGNKYIDSLYRCQRWFFNPRKYDYEGDAIIEYRVFAEDAIPLSMGGRRTHHSPIAAYPRPARNISEENPNALPSLDHQNRSNQHLENDKSLENQAYGGEVELSMVPKRLAHRSGARSDSSSQGSFSDDELSVDTSGIPERLIRDPDLVDFPHLKSSSKVAVPAGGTPYKNHTPPENDVAFLGLAP